MFKNTIAISIIAILLGCLVAIGFQACTAPFLEVQVTQRADTQDDPVSINSDLQGSIRKKVSEVSPDIKTTLTK